MYSKVRIRFLSSGHFSKSRFLKRSNIGPCHKIVSRRQKIYSNRTSTYSGFKYNHNCYSCVYKTFPNHRYMYFQFSWIYDFQKISFLAGKAGFEEHRKWGYKYIVPKYSALWYIFLIVPVKKGLLNSVRQHVKIKFSPVEIMM